MADINNYPNPLDNFRSYSYHFILTLANTTEAHRKLLEKDGFMSAVNGVKLGERLKLGDEQAYLLVDTRRFSQFSITGLETTQVYGTGSVANPSIPASMMKMRLIDTTGLTFFNFLHDTMKNKIQSTRSSAFFMLAIVFTGHDDSNPSITKTISTCFIPLLLSNMAFEFSSSGSTYDLEFIEIDGNPGAAVPQMIDLGDIQAVTTELTKTNTVGGMVQALENRLNMNSTRFFQKYSNEANARQGQKTADDLAGKLVQYMLTVPKDWANFQINTAGKSKNVEQVFVTKTKEQDDKTKAALAANVQSAQASGDTAKVNAAIKARDSFTSFNYSMSVQDAITHILESSKDYLALGSMANREEGKAQVHKTILTLSSDVATYLMHFDVYPYSAQKVDANTQKDIVQTSTNTNNRLPDGQVKNLLKYDYIFSGRNSHVLDFKIEFNPHAAAPMLDMDLNMGQNRLADNGAAGQKERKVDAAASNGKAKTSEYNPLMRPGEPVFIPAKTRDQQNGFTSMNTEESADGTQMIKAKQEHTNTLAVLHFLGSMNATMTIRGNPNLLKKYCDTNTRGGMPPHTLNMKAADLKALSSSQLVETADDFFRNTISAKLSSGKEIYRTKFLDARTESKVVGTDPILHGNDIAVSPMFAKINIFAPNVDFLGNPMRGESLYTNKFFYDGVYMVMFITHSFENGSFKQTLTLIPHDIDGSFSEATAPNSTKQTGKTA